MYIRQYNYPHVFDLRDAILTRDSNRLFQQEPQRTDECYRRHTGESNPQIEYWLLDSSDKQIMDFLLDLLDPATVRPGKVWTGFRVLGSVISGGEPVYSFALFAKHPDTDTEVYTGENAPNVSKYD